MEVDPVWDASLLPEEDLGQGDHHQAETVQQVQSLEAESLLNAGPAPAAQLEKNFDCNFCEAEEGGSEEHEAESQQGKCLVPTLQSAIC